jgi:hypothetical protein
VWAGRSAAGVAGMGCGHGEGGDAETGEVRWTRERAAMKPNGKRVDGRRHNRKEERRRHGTTMMVIAMVMVKVR